MSRTSVMKYIARVINQVAISIILYDGLCCLWFHWHSRPKVQTILHVKRWWCFSIFVMIFVSFLRAATGHALIIICLESCYGTRRRDVLVWFVSFVRAEEHGVVDLRNLWLLGRFGRWWLRMVEFVFRFILVIVQKNI